ncbi:unnamed protein product [Arctia plantaginis]|uniref:Uncharacterized protein n=1 Tax=Arctia plantaginis TaxID=874455 RepID=A0A8S1A6B7_ARCPL|nr:unnamed protein product [Arctia plantaginis]
MQYLSIVVLVALVSVAMCLPLESGVPDGEQKEVQSHSLQRRFVNPMFVFGSTADSGFRRMRTKREADDICEKLALCKLHARSRSNFVAAFELYFVNRENARQWDHHSRSLEDCETRFGDCYEE